MNALLTLGIIIAIWAIVAGAFELYLEIHSRLAARHIDRLIKKGWK